MQIYYVLPVLLIGAAVAYSLWASKRVAANAANMSPEEAAKRFHDSYSHSFHLEPGELVVGAWNGVEFQGAPSATARVAGAALNQASAAVLGVSTYVPRVQIVLTSTNRVLVSREYSELGQRGNFEQHAALGPGTRALDGATARPGESLGMPPANPFNPAAALEFVQLRAPSGETYEAWLSPQGGRVGRPGFSSIRQSLG
jgi:hypothetical protein